MTAASDALARNLELAALERQAANTRELEAKRQLEAALAADRAAAAARLGLTTARDEAAIDSEVTSGKLGNVRANLAAAERLAEAAADSVAGGAAPTETALAETGEQVDTLRRLLAAHGRRAAAAQAAVELVEIKLLEHDTAEAVHQAEQLEALMVTTAELVDERMMQAIQLAEAVGGMIDQRRLSGAREPWQHDMQAGPGRFLALGQAFSLASWSANPLATSRGETNARSFAEAVAVVISCWSAGRDPLPSQAA